MHWRKNYFSSPQNKAGKEFVEVLARLYLAFGMCSFLESIAMKATIVFPLLLLQKPHCTSKNEDHTICLKREWRTGKIRTYQKLSTKAKLFRIGLPVKAMCKTKIQPGFFRFDVCRKKRGHLNYKQLSKQFDSSPRWSWKSYRPKLKTS